MRIAIASDHAGFKYKEMVKDFLEKRGHETADFGTDSTERCDYPDFIGPAAGAVSNMEAGAGIVFGGSGNGEAMAANKIKGIRCAVCWNTESAKLAKTHNNANMISIGERMVEEKDLLNIVETWLVNEFEAGRHVARLEKLHALEK